MSCVLASYSVLRNMEASDEYDGDPRWPTSVTKSCQGDPQAGFRSSPVVDNHSLIGSVTAGCQDRGFSEAYQTHEHGAGGFSDPRSIRANNPLPYHARSLVNASLAIPCVMASGPPTASPRDPGGLEPYGVVLFRSVRLKQVSAQVFPEVAILSPVIYVELYSFQSSWPIHCAVNRRLGSWV